MAAGFGEDKIYAKKLLGITAMERLVGREQFNGLLGPYIKKPLGNQSWSVWMINDRQ